MKKTIANKKGGVHRKTMKANRSKNHNNIKNHRSHIVCVFLEILNMVKLFHWKTHSYAQHKATDALYENLNENIDKFIEVLLGKDKKRITMMEKKLDLIDPHNEREFKTKIYDYRDFLINMDKYFNKKGDSDLISIRDDILVDINQFLYLMSLS